ncbi:unnamed protein product [Cochlearia groenlandica]
MLSNSILPIDLIVEILSRLPPKSLARFHCVSKQWASILYRPYFTEMFLSKSSTHPHLLFAIEENGLWTFFSLRQRHTPYKNSTSSSSSSTSLVETAEFHMKFPPESMEIYPHSNRKFSLGYASGLFYFYGMRVKERYYNGLPVICNPKNGRYSTLPLIFRYRRSYSFLGFDPINKEYKVLFMAYPCCMDHRLVYYDDTIEFRVWVLEDAEKHEWSKYAYTARDDKFSVDYVSVVGVIATGEIVLWMGDYSSKNPFYVFYLNPERNTLRRVEIRGFGEYHGAFDNPSRVYVFVDDCSIFYQFADHVQDLNVKDTKLLNSSICTPYVVTGFEAEDYEREYHEEHGRSVSEDEGEEE